MNDSATGSGGDGGEPPEIGFPGPSGQGRRKGLWIALAVVTGVIVVLGGASAFFALRGGDEPPPATLSDTTSTDAASAAPAGDGTVDGTWSVEAGDSFVGYRVGETIVSIGTPSEAVGRTSAVTGGITIVGSSVDSGTFTADMTQLESDEFRRDRRLRTDGLETDEFREASFELTEPIALRGDLEPGAVVETTARGELTLHGVTNPVEVSVQARWDGSTIEIAGSTEIQMSDYDIAPPSVGGIVSVEDHGVVEFKLVLTGS